VVVPTFSTSPQSRLWHNTCQEAAQDMLEDSGTIRGSLPKGWLRLLLRFPIGLYRLHLGWLLGHRFLLLTHVGRTSGTQHQTVLEVVRYDSVSNTCLVGSGWGEQAQWLKNILVTPEVTVTLGTKTYKARAERLRRTAANQEFREYGHRHPQTLKQLTRIMLGRVYQGSDDDFALLAENVPLVELRTVETSP
jgi:deazaflavin-dependent oxidoreductase (nitroreductase family)